MTDSKELVAKIKKGDSDSFYVLIEQYKRLVFNVVYRMVLNEADREDVCQDIFVKVYQNLHSFHFKSKLSTWIVRISVNTCINHLKKKKVPLFDDFTADTETIENTRQDGHTPDDYTESEDLSEKLQCEINRLPHQFRTILTLYHLEEMSYSEISEALDLPDGTVKSYLFRARKLLKERLMDKYQQEELWHAST